MLLLVVSGKEGDTCVSGERRSGMSCGEVFRWDNPSVRAARMGAEAELHGGDSPASILLCFSTPPWDMTAVGITPH